jgi:hypothetical protein
MPVISIPRDIAAVLLVFVLASCAETEPEHYPIVGRTKEVSFRDIELAIQSVHQRLRWDRRPFMPIYRVYVENRDEIEVNCGPHYGSAEAAGALTFTVERIKGVWRVTHVNEYIPNPERVIIT